MQKPLAVANEIIKIAKGAGRAPTQMKLQKLLFYAHGWHLALTDKPLFDESIEAWKFGPVVPSVYHEFKGYGRNRIEKEGTELSFSGGSVAWVAPQVEDESGYVQALLNKIWEVFGKFSGVELVEMTHRPGTPWWTVVAAYGANPPRGVTIPNEDIADYFKSFMKPSA